MLARATVSTAVRAAPPEAAMAEMVAVVVAATSVVVT